MADGDELQPSVEKAAAKAGDAGAKTLGQKLSSGLKTDGLKAFGVAASAAFALATKGALDLNEVQAQFQSQTGASADEAAAAAKTINRVAGQEQMSLQAVTEAAIRVRRDLGATGDEADHLTAKIARFARVTHQDAGEAVSAVDDILDNWGLTLKDADGLLDKLIVSQHRWGGDLKANQVTLAKLAPAMRAANFQIDDGIALLGLFGSKGLDSERAAAAFSKALTKVKSPAELQRLIKDISDTEDPFLRAQKAADLFGAKAGAQLANALDDVDLNSYKVSVEDAAGAVDQAADTIDSSIRGRIAKAFSVAGATIRGFGADLGPAVTGLAGLASLGGALGGGKLLKGLASITVKPLAGLGVRMATAIAEGLASSAAVNSMGSNVAAAVSRIPGVGAVKSGLSKLGGLLGSPLGKVMGIAAASAFAIWFVDELTRQRAEVAQQAGSIAESVGQEIKSGTDAQLEQAKAALKAGMDAIVAETKRGLVQMANPQQLDALQALVDQYNAVQTELNRRAALAAQVTQDALKNARPGTAAAAQDLIDEFPTAFQKRAAIIAANARNFLAKPIGEQLVLLGAEARRAAADISLGLASGIRDKRSAIDSAIAQLKTDIKNGLKPGKEIGKDIGLLMGRAIRTGLKSADPEIKAQAEGTRALIEARLIELVKSGGKAGQDVLDELAKKMHSKDPAVRHQAQRTKDLIDAALKAQPPKTPGDKVGEDLAADLRSKGPIVGREAYNLGVDIARNIRAGVQGSGVVSISGGGGGGKKKRQHGGPVDADEPYIVGERGPEWFVPKVPGVVLPNTGAPGAATVASISSAGSADGGDTYFQLFLPDAQHRDPWTVLDRLPRYAKVAKAAAGETGWKAAR